MTSREFARLLGLSQATVSRALNNSPLVTETRKEFIRAKAAELGFQLNSQAQGLRTNRTGTIGILFPHHYKSMNENPMLANMYDHLQRKLIGNGYDVMMIYDYGPDDGVSVFERIIKRRKIDGLINFRLELSENEIRLIRESGFSCVSMLDARTLTDGLHYCLSDTENGGYQAGMFLGAFDDFEMMYIGIDNDVEDSSKRRRGFVRGLARRKRKLGDGMDLSCNLSFLSAYEFAGSVKSAIRGRKVAVFAYSDVVALGLANGLRDSGVGIPEQVQVLGMDDIPLASWIKPRLSTLRVAAEEIVSAGGELLLSLIEGKVPAKHRTMFKPTLIQRETTLRRESPEEKR